MAERVDLDRYADDFGYHLEHAAPGSALEECARWGLGLVALVRAAREVVDAAASYVGYGMPDLDRAVAAYDQAAGRPATADQPPGAR